MSMHTDLIEATHDFEDAVKDAEELLEQTHGSNLDPVMEALDRRLLTETGEIDASVFSCLRSDPVARIDLEERSAATGGQLAARMLCDVDEHLLVSLTAAAACGVGALVPVIATGLFTRVRPQTMAASSALAALIVVRGIEPFCRDMGWDVKLAPRAS
jgi:hypothetical protein